VCGVRCGVTPYPCRMAFGCPSWLFSKRGLVRGMRVLGCRVQSRGVPIVVVGA